jgi:hypothetical protein
MKRRIGSVDMCLKDVFMSCASPFCTPELGHADWPFNCSIVCSGVPCCRYLVCIKRHNLFYISGCLMLLSVMITTYKKHCSCYLLTIGRSCSARLMRNTDSSSIMELLGVPWAMSRVTT